MRTGLARFAEHTFERGEISPSLAHLYMNTLYSGNCAATHALFYLFRTSKKSTILKLLKLTKLKQISRSRQKSREIFYSACRASPPHVK
jgi:hypothetical protein